MKAALYARVSTDKQDETLQIPRLEEYAKTHQFEVIGVYQDECSGTTDNRPGWQNLLSDCKEGKVDCIVAVKLDRIMRSVINLENTMILLKKYNVALITLDFGEIKQDDPMSAMFMRMLSIFAQFERDMISKRTSDALAAKKAKGVKLGRPMSAPPDLKACAILRKQGYGWKRIAATVGRSPHTLDKYREEIEELSKELPNHTFRED